MIKLIVVSKDSILGKCSYFLPDFVIIYGEKE